MYAHALLAALALAPLPDSPRPRQGKFVSLEERGGKVVALKTAVVTYEKGDARLDLVAAIHVGDRDYYRALNRQFTFYDALLYELVAPQGLKPAKGLDIVGVIAKLALDLESQKERVDYRKPNFVHADLSFQEMGAAMRKRGDNGLTLGLRVAADIIQQANLDADKPPADLSGLLDADGPLGVKRFLALQLAGDDKTPPSLAAVLVRDRNQAALKVLDQQLRDGKRKLGLFYGAAHMPDFEERLLQGGWKRKGETWLTAWDLDGDD